MVFDTNNIQKHVDVERRGPRWIAAGLMLLLIVIGFGFRVAYAQRTYFHIDEYVSMLAMRRIIEVGVPILPSGSVYDTEIAFSYFGGFFTLLLGGGYVATPLGQCVSGGSVDSGGVHCRSTHVFVAVGGRHRGHPAGVCPRGGDLECPVSPVCDGAGPGLV